MNPSVFSHHAETPVWDDAPWAGLPHLDRTVTADVCVVGLGGSGLACVAEARAAGLTVVGIDAGTVAGGAAGRNGGFLLAGTYHFYHDAVQALGRDRARALYRATIGQIERMWEETPDAVRLVGSLRIADTVAEEEDCRQQMEAMLRDGLPVEWYDGVEGRGLLIPTDGSFQPLRRCRTLAARVSDGGAELFEHTPALALRGGEVVTPAGRISCETVLVTVDGRMDRVVPELAGRVRTARLQMLATAPDRTIRIPRPVYARWGYEYWQQLLDGRITLGGFRDAGGEGEWTEEAAPSREVQTRLETFLRERIGSRAEVMHRWAASVGYTADGMPVLEEVRPRVWAAGGYSGTGNVVGALCGRALAQLAATGESALAELFRSTGRAVADRV